VYVAVVQTVSAGDDPALSFQIQVNRMTFPKSFLLVLALGFSYGCHVAHADPPATAKATAPAATATADPADTQKADPLADPKPSWIWGPGDAAKDEERFFRTTFDAQIPTTHMTENPSSAFLWAAGDNDITVFLNGKPVAKNSGKWDRAVLADVRSNLKAGENVLAVKCTNTEGPAGIAVKLEIRGTYRETFTLVTDGSWKTWTGQREGWRGGKVDLKGATAARVIGGYGIEPWGQLELPEPGQATPVADITVPDGFKIDLVYSVPKIDQGSWVCMTPDPKGRLYVSDQNGALYRVTLPSGEKKIAIEKVALDIGGAQGMLWAFDSLYVVVNGGREPNTSGLYRLRDTNGDDKLDELKKLKRFLNRTGDGPAGSEHGPHAVVLGPDKKLYVVAGNFTSLPEGLSPNSPVQNWAEDILLPRMTDGRGHDPTIYAPAGWICRTDEEGKTWEAFASGMRNTYDFAFNPQGEIFSFDSDMEWDIGSPWWRPIRICHVVSGGEFGWRNGSAKWPTYYPDSVPPVVNVGKGSPTGVTFGTDAKFPAKYQRALFAADWAYGKIFAVYPTPQGAGYTATFEPFIVGKPFDVTDCIVNPTDGAMYITIGGRGTQSGLYRVTYVGDESTAKAAPVAEDSDAVAARALRHKLEAFHGHRDPAALDLAWPQLGSSDRMIRFAARVAVEAQDPVTWTERALKAEKPQERITALIALCRVGNASLQPRILGALNQLDLAKLPKEQLLEALRAYELAFIRMGKPFDPAAGPAVASRLDALFPNDDDDVNHELAQLLAYLEAPKTIEKSLALLEKAKTQEEQLYYAFQLRNLRPGWTAPQREAYFNWLNRAQANYTGGASYKLFLKKVRDDAIATLGDNEKDALALLLKPPMELAHGEAAGEPPVRKFVKNWKMEDLTPKLAELRSGRSFESGKAAFDAVSCIKCHRFGGDGGASGPDITGVGNRFQAVDLLEAIISPSKVISDQYQATEIITKKKEVFVGTVHEENDQQVVIRSSPLSTATDTVLKKDIKERRPSKLSMMPQGLLDVLNENEVLDLLAYLRSAGDSKDPAFAKSSSEAAAK
jgi:putative heme-binding domain-containing protein